MDTSWWPGVTAVVAVVPVVLVTARPGAAARPPGALGAAHGRGRRRGPVVWDQVRWPRHGGAGGEGS
ncbi:hypothetical protein [Streptomyces sp. G-G2]|uniref:hypothetical protein n=1 Tax=Streptomyces sp. G-G2 TaxID=3046201 RepID=UPI0024BB96D7|nr:hypothetical protein [Streptomyces sp. G-G2]MDJ0379620.1 hypothetical protein [Streptomyces sp. G-G2]